MQQLCSLSRYFLCLAVCASVAALQNHASGAEGSSSPYSDAIGDIDPSLPSWGGTLDIVGMEVSNTPTDITFKLTVNGNVTSPDWAKYMIGIATQKSEGTLSQNAWARPIFLSYDNNPLAASLVGMNHWIGAWVDGSSLQAPVGGSEFYTFNNGSNIWERNAATWDAGTYPFPYSVTANAQSMIEWSFPLSLMNLVPGNVIYFDAYSSDGANGATAADSLANPLATVSNWSTSYSSFATTAGGPGLNAYTIVVPEPSTYIMALAVLACGGYSLSRRPRVR